MKFATIYAKNSLFSLKLVKGCCRLAQMGFERGVISCMFVLVIMDKDFLDIIKIIATALIAVVGWLIGHYFTSKRDKTNKRRDLTIEHLINAYRILTDEISNRPQTKESERKLELIIAEIQLFGSKEQVQMAKDIANNFAAKKDYEYDTLINSLRADLRIQLNLEPIKGNVTWLRVDGWRNK